ncbi:MAG TPA: glycosyltransferase [bacterium]|nr:glycosyltransferase [bacterium]
MNAHAHAPSHHPSAAEPAARRGISVLGFSHLWPKSPGDKRGVYIRQMYDRLATRNDVRILIPDAPELLLAKPAAGTVEVLPFRYGVPRRFSTFGYGGGLTGEQRLSRASLALAPFYALAATRELFARRATADVIHAHFLVPNGAIAALAHGTRPLVISLHGSDVYLAEKSAPMRAAARIAIREAAHIVPCSEDLAERVIELGADPERVTVIPYGVDPAIFARPVDEASKAAVRARAGAGTRPMVLFVGNLQPKKGVTHLLDAARRVLAERPDTFFCLVGAGPLERELKAKAASLGLSEKDVRFMGEVPWAEIPAWYAAADVFVAPSVIDASGNVDGLPNVVLEGMASALPVVASRVAGIGMVVKPGDTGWLVPPGNDEALARALREVLADLSAARVRGANARRFLESQMTWDRIAARYEQVFARVLASQHR